MPATRLLALTSLLLATACGAVTVTPGNVGPLAARPATCSIEFLRTKVPDRPYDEVASLHWEGTMKGAAGAQEELRVRACALGADAVIVTRDYVPYTQNSSGFMTVTAVRYRPAPAP
jgi:hypothetical protein